MTIGAVLREQRDECKKSGIGVDVIVKDWAVEVLNESGFKIVDNSEYLIGALILGEGYRSQACHK